VLLIFDLDGTLIDSVGDLAASASELVTTLGGRPLSTSEVGDMVGEGAALLVRRALQAAGLDPETPNALQQFLEIYDRRLLDTTTPYDGVPEALLLASRRARLAVLTNKPVKPSLRILDALGLSKFFDAMVAGDSPHGRKPESGGLKHLVSELSATSKSPLRSVMLVGDSPIDWMTATRAGCAFAWARYGFGAARFDGRAPETPYVLERPADLASVVDRFSAVMSGR
jgi:phosphoglycolate phosphatase